MVESKSSPLGFGLGLGGTWARCCITPYCKNCSLEYGVMHQNSTSIFQAVFKDCFWEAPPKKLHPYLGIAQIAIAPSPPC